MQFLATILWPLFRLCLAYEGTSRIQRMTTWRIILDNITDHPIGDLLETDRDKAALAKFVAMVEAEGGNVDTTKLLFRAVPRASSDFPDGVRPGRNPAIYTHLPIL